MPRERLGYTALGLNHLTWFTELSRDGVELVPRLPAWPTGGRTTAIGARASAGNSRASFALPLRLASLAFQVRMA